MPQQKENRKWRILVCDDEPDVLDIVSKILEIKYEVATARNGLELLQKIDLVEPDFIVLDVMMPVMNGFETCEAIRRYSHFREIPIYFLTAKTSPDDIKKAYSLGATFYITKPFDPDRLLKNIDLHFENLKFCDQAET